MKTLLEIKEEYAKTNHYDSFNDLFNDKIKGDPYELAAIFENIADLYGQEVWSKWISVEDSLPEFDQIVPVQLNRSGHIDFVMGYRVKASISTDNREGWVLLNKYWHKQEEVTHWTPLPIA